MADPLAQLLNLGDLQTQVQGNYAQALRDKRQYQEISRQAGERFSNALSKDNPVALDPADVFNAYQSFNAAIKPGLTADQDILQQIVEIAKQREANTLSEKKMAQDQANSDRSYQLESAKAGISIDPTTGKLVISGTTAKLDDLLKTRKSMIDQGLSTEQVDSQLKLFGLDPTKSTQSSGDLTSQINKISTVGERNGARAVKDILDVVETAIEKAGPENSPTSTGPLSAVGAKISKTRGKVTPTVALEKDLAEILRTIRKESTGVAFSEQEIKDLEREIPTIFQQEGNVRDSLTRLKGRMLAKLSNYGIDVSGQMSDQNKQTSSGYLIEEVK